MFFAGAFLALPMVAQNEPIRNPETDPKEIYLQDFESDWDTWSTVAVDTIDGLNYFKTDELKTSSGYKIWEKSYYKAGVVHRDTLIYLYNGVKKTGDADEISKGVFDNDTYNIIADAEDDFTRQKALDAFGTNGGKKYFKYVSTDGSKASQYSSGSVPSYRRNLFIRLKPGVIEENSSYRITMYVKATKLENPLGEKNGKTHFQAEFMRGYFDSEKNFSMGRDNDNVFTYEKSDFKEGEWTKVTYMSYFLTNEVAEQYCYYAQYYDSWGKRWSWKNQQVEDAGFDSLVIIRQPNKFFLRVSFRGDSTVYDLDNMSITKSTIGGIQHTGGLLRVDFGYQTNLKDQALAAKERTNVPAVELPGQFFTVRGYKASTGKWQKIGISTAEYHDDGYMYMWARPGAGGQTIKFENYDSVLVSFTNPTGVEYDTLALKYTGNLYPNALDEEWVNAGKRVFDFTNEVSTPNPNIATGVYQMKNYPPVIRPNGAPYEDGAFGLDPNLNKITLRMSRKLDIDPTDVNGTGEKAFCQVFKNGVKVETWPATESTDTYTTFTRQATSAMEGDYTFKFIQIKGVGDSKYSDDIVLNYHFGSFDKNPTISFVKSSDWRSRIDDYNVSSRPIPTNIWIHTGESKDTFKEGDGKSQGTKIGLYVLKDDTITVAGAKVPDNVLFYMSNRISGETGNVYFIESLTKGNYAISFRLAGRSSVDYPLTVKFYAKPATALVKGNDKGFALLEGIKDKQVLLADKKPASGTDIGEGGATKTWASGTEVITLPFNVPADGDYIFEFLTTGSSNYCGVAVSNYWITTAGDLSFTSVKNLNDAIATVTAKLASVTENKYKGPDYSALQAAETAAKGYVDATIAANKGNLPSAYAAQVKIMEDAINVLQLHMDTVDLFYTAYDTVTKAIAAQAKYSGLEAYTKLNALKTQYASYDCSRYTNKQISDDADILNAGVKNLNVRIEKHNDFADLLTLSKKTIDSAYVIYDKPELLGKSLFEHDTLNQVYEAALAQKDGIGAMTDSAFYALYEGLKGVRFDYLNAMDAIKARTRQIRELYVLAVDTLGYDFGSVATKDSIKTLVYDLRKRDPELENVLRQAAVLQIYKKFAAGATFDTLDVSALIPNYFLASEGEVGVTMRQKSSGTMVVSSSDNNLIFPGWNLVFGGSSAICYPGKVAMTDEREVHAVIGGLHVEPNTTVTFSSTVTEMPAAEYYSTVTFGQNNVSYTTLSIKTDSTSISKPREDLKSSTSKTHAFDKVKIPFNQKKNKVSDLKYSYGITYASGSGHVDITCVNLYLTKADPKCDYAALVTAQEAKLADMITFVAPVVVAAEPIAVQYYNLNGVQVLAPEAGKVVIKRTILSNGKSVAEKILVK